VANPRACRPQAGRQARPRAATSEKIKTIGGLIGSVLYPAAPAGRYGWSSRYRPVSTATVSATETWRAATRTPSGQSSAARGPGAATPAAREPPGSRAARASLRALLHRPGATTDEPVTQIRALLHRPGAGAAWQAFQHHETA
jgi:hypothetical protein